MHQHLLHNGQVRNAKDILLSPGQVGYLNGWGVFSTLRVAEGVLFAFERHFARLQRDARLLRVPFEWSPADLYSSLSKLLEANAAYDAVLRVAIVRNHGGIFEGPEPTPKADLVAFTSDVRHWGAEAKLTYEPNARFGASPFAGAKVTSWAQNLAIYEKVTEAGFDEAVLLNEEGQVSECTSANIFAIRGESIITPPLKTSGCLPGVTRAILLEDIHVSGITIGERELTPSELEASDGVFITSSTRDLLPVRSIGGYVLRQEKEIFHALKNAFASNFRTYIAHASSDKVLVPS